jgi:cytochrome P450
LPLVGHLIPYGRDPLRFLTRCAREHGDVVRIGLPGLTLYMLNHPEHIEHVLRGNHHNFIKDKLTRRLSGLVGQGLLTSEGETWRRHRQLAQPAFQVSAVQRYAPVMVEHTQRMLARWQDGRQVDVHAELTALTLGIVAKVLFDADTSEQAHTVGEAVELMADYYLNPLNFSQWFQALPTPGNLRFRRAVRRLDDILFAIVRRRREQGNDPGDLLSRLLAARDAEGGLTDGQLRDELVTLFLAGHETTALVLSYSCYLLATSWAAAQRWHGELDAELGARAPTAADVPRLRYTEWVVREAMRLYPPAWSIGREALGPCEIGGYAIPKGAQMFLVQWVVQRDPRWFDEPEAFRPERWDNDLLRRLPRGAYFPFGDGPRVCIGNHFAMLEAVLVLATIGQRFTLEPASGFQLKLVPSVTLRPGGGVHLVLKARKAPEGTPPQRAGAPPERHPSPGGPGPR